MDALVTLFVGDDDLLIEQIADALRTANLHCVRTQNEAGQTELKVQVAEVASAAAILAEFLPQGGVRASAPRPMAVPEAQPPPAPLPAPPMESVGADASSTAADAPKQESATTQALAAQVVVFVSFALAVVGVVRGEQSIASLLVWFGLGLGSTRALQKPNAATLAVWSNIAFLWLFGLATLVPFIKSLDAPALTTSFYGAAFLSAAVVVALILGGLVQSFRPGATATAGRGWVLASVAGASLFGVGVASGLARNRLPDPETKPHVVTNEPLNFRLKVPGGWSSLPAAKYNKDASVLLTVPSSGRSFMIIAEKGLVRFDAKSLLELSTSRSDRLTLPTVQGDDTFTVAGQPARRARGRSKELQAGSLTIINVAMVSKGFGYQFACWAPLDQEVALQGWCDELLAGFELIDPSRIGAPEAVPPAPFQGTREGFTVALPAPWQPMKPGQQEKDWPFATYVATCENDATLAISAYPIDGPLPVEVLERVALDLSGLSPTGTERRSATIAGTSVTEFVAHDEDGRTDHHLVALAHQGRLITVIESRVREATCPAGLSTPQLVAPSGPLPTPRDPSVVHRALGRAHTEANAWQAAVTAYDRAMQSKRDDYTAAWALVDLGRETPEARPQVAEVLAQTLRGRPANDPMRAIHANFLVAAGRGAEAVKAFEALFKAGFEDDEFFADWVHALEALKRRDQAWKQLRAYQRTHDTNRVCALEAGLLSREGKSAAAVALLEARLSRTFDEKLVALLVRFLSNLDRHERVVEWVTRLQDRGVADVETLATKADSEFALSRYASARQTAEAGLRMDPRHAGLLQLRRAVLDELGQGNNAALREPIELVAFPAGVPLVPPSGATESNAESEYLFLGRAIRFEPGKVYAETNSARIVIANQEDLERWSTLSFGFNPRFEQIFLNELQVTDAQGVELGRARADDCYLADSADDEHGTNARTMYVPVPGLTVGATIQYQVTTRRLTPPSQLPFTEHFFARTLPVRLSVLSVDAPADAARLAAGSGVERIEAKAALFVARKLEAVSSEPFGIEYERYLPFVWVSDSKTTWEFELDDFRKEAGAVLEPDVATVALGKKLTVGVPEAERPVVLARYVRDNVVYKALEFGRGARVPRRPQDVLSRRYGDCKDQSLLLWNLLRGAGVEARLALVRSAGVVREDSPSLDQFDHMIVQVPSAPFGFIDPTMRWNNPLEGAGQLKGQRALPIMPGPATFVTVPQTPKLEEVVVERSLKVAGADLEVKEQVTLVGPFGEAVRSELFGVPARLRTQRLEAWLEAKAEVSKVELENLDVPSRPLKVTIEYVQRQAVHRVGDDVIITAPSSWERRRASVPRVDRRRGPFQTRLAFSLRASTWLEAEQGVTLAPSVGSGTGKGMQWSVNANSKGSGRVFTYERERFESQASEYEAWRTAHEPLEAALAKPFVLTPRR